MAGRLVEGIREGEPVALAQEVESPGPRALCRGPPWNRQSRAALPTQARGAVSCASQIYAGGHRAHPQSQGRTAAESRGCVVGAEPTTATASPAPPGECPPAAAASSTGRAPRAPPSAPRRRRPPAPTGLPARRTPPGRGRPGAARREAAWLSPDPAEAAAPGGGGNVRLKRGWPASAPRAMPAGVRATSSKSSAISWNGRTRAAGRCANSSEANERGGAAIAIHQETPLCPTNGSQSPVANRAPTAGSGSNLGAEAMFTLLEALQSTRSAAWYFPSKLEHPLPRLCAGPWDGRRITSRLGRRLQLDPLRDPDARRRRPCASKGGSVPANFKATEVGGPTAISAKRACG